MENNFYTLVESNPFLILVVIIGSIFAISSLLNARQKIHDLLGYKTKSEVEKHDYMLNEKERDEQIAEMRKEIKGMHDELRSALKALEEDMKNVKQADIMILGDRISQKSTFYLQAGAIPPDEIREFQSMYETYRAIGGNHGVDKIFEKTISALPLSIDKEEFDE